MSNGKPKHFMNSYTDQAMVLSLGIPEEDSIHSSQVTRCIKIHNRFMKP